MRTRALVTIGLLACALAPGARADGGPSVKENLGFSGIVTPTGFRYVIVDTPDTAVLVRLAPSGRIVAEKYLPGRFTIQGVAYDGTPTGFSADGKTLVLVRPRMSFPRERTRFLVLATPGLYIRENVVLEGDFTLDAISPDGSLLYFIHYLSKKDPGKYEVRAFDRDAGKLLPEPIVDRSEPDEEMRGSPISRVSSPDGRWAYTLYDGAGKTPFVHALDTVGMAARCIDLDALAGREDLADLRLRLQNGELNVMSGGTAILSIAMPSYGVTEHSESWLPFAAGLAALFGVAAAGALLVRRRRRLAPVA